MRVCDNIDGYGFKSFLIRRMVMVLNLIVPYLTLPPRPKIVRASSCSLLGFMEDPCTILVLIRIKDPSAVISD